MIPATPSHSGPNDSLRDMLRELGGPVIGRCSGLPAHLAEIADNWQLASVYD